MIAEDLKAFEDQIYAFVGREVCPPTRARDDVNTATIRQWTEIIGDRNPAYTDAAWAAISARGNTIAPPAMLYVWGQEGFTVTTGRPADAQADLVSLFNQHGYTGVCGAAHGIEEAPDDQWREAERELVGEQDLRVAYERPAEREHLLLATRQ